jgi:hypothetical protein
MSEGSTRVALGEVQPDEEITSFVFRADQIVRATGTIKPSRLMPRRKSKAERLEVSVCRSSRLKSDALWTICSTHFDVDAPSPAIGRGVGPATAIFSEGLLFDPDGDPYREHANIIGWHDAPDKPDNELKHFWIDKAQRMAKQCRYSPRQ